MLDTLWANHSVPLIFVPETPTGVQVKELAREWTKSGLLGPSIWINHAKFLESPELTTIEATLMYSTQMGELHEDIESSLLRYLTRNEIRTLRVVSLRVADRSHATMPEIEISVTRVAALLQEALALQDVSDSARENNAKILKYDLLAFPSRHEFQRAANSLWPITVVAAPEDRRNPWAIDSFVAPELIVPFSLSSLATVAGIWSGINEGALDHLAAEFTNPGKAVVMRTYIRAITSEGMARRLSAKVLKKLSDPRTEVVENLGVTSKEIYAIPSADIESRIDAMVSMTYKFSENSLSPSPKVEAQNEVENRITIIRQVLLFLQFSVDRLIRIPKWTWLSIQRFVAKRLKNSLYGQRSKVIIGPDDEKAYDGKDRAIRALCVSLTQLIRNFESSTVESAPNRVKRLVDSRLYSEIRRLIFAMSDGSELPDGANVVAYSGKDRLVFSRVTDFLIDYEASHDQMSWHWDNSHHFEKYLPLGLNQGWDVIELSDLKNVVRLPKVMHQCHESIVAEMHQLGFDEITESDDSIELPPQVDAYPASDDENSSQDYDDAADDVSESAVSEDDDTHATEIDSLRDLLKLIELDIESLNLWKANFESSFNWKLAASMENDEVDSETEELLQLERIQQLESVPPSVLIDLRNRFLRGFWRSITVASIFPFLLHVVLAYAGTLVAGIFSFILGATIARIILWIVGLWLLNLLRMLIKYHKAWKEYSEEMTRVELAYRDAVESLRRIRSEQPRMKLSHGNVRQWLYLLSRSIQDPYDVSDEWASEDGASPIRVVRPEALRIAQAVDEASPAMKRLNRFAMAKQCTVGFRGELYRHQVQAVRDFMKYQESEFSEEVLDRDDAKYSNSTRRTFLKALFESSEADPDQAPKLTIGRDLMRNLMNHIQVEGLKESQPKVKPDDVDERIIKLREQAFESSDNFGAIEWDDFLLEAIGTSMQPVPPFQPNVFSGDGQLNELHTNPNVIIQAPKRVSKSVVELARQEFRIKEYGRGPAGQAEILCRTDFKVVEIDKLSVFSSRSNYNAVDSIQESKRSLLGCPKCGSITCPTADPQSTLSCVNSGI